MTKNYSRIALGLGLLFSAINSQAQNIAINTTGASANASAMLDIASNGNLGLLIPRVTLAQRTAMNPLAAAAQGLTVYQTDGVQGFYYNTSTTTTPTWSYLTPGGWSLTGNAGTVASTNFIGTTDAIDFVARTNNVERMRILSGGNVGINTSTPAYKFTIAPSSTFGYGDGTATYSSRTETRDDAGLAGSAGAQSGFFQTSAPSPAADWPSGASSWWHLLDIRHSNDANNYAMQFSGSFFDQKLYFRKTNGAANTAWSEVFTSSSLIGQSATNYYSTAALTLATATVTYVPGFPVTITVPANSTVIMAVSIGAQTTATGTNGASVVDIIGLVDGAIPTNGAYQRLFITNNAAYTTQTRPVSFTEAFTLTAGSHTFGVGAYLAGGSTVTVGGNNTSVLQGTMTLTIIKN